MLERKREIIFFWVVAVFAGFLLLTLVGEGPFSGKQMECMELNAIDSKAAQSCILKKEVEVTSADNSDAQTMRRIWVLYVRYGYKGTERLDTEDTQGDWLVQPVEAQLLGYRKALNGDDGAR